MNQVMTVAALAVCFGLSCIQAGQSFGQGKITHDLKKHTSDHRQAMLALKERIPEEYRVMQRTPIVPDKASVDRGRELYIQQCAACHGPKGRGDGPTAAALATPPADFLDLEHSSIYGPGEKFWVIGHGSGQTGMPAFPQIELLDRWHLVNFILDLQKKEKPKEQPHQHKH